MNHKKKLALCAAVPLLVSNMYWVSPVQIHAISNHDKVKVTVKEEAKYPKTKTELENDWKDVKEENGTFILDQYQGGAHAVVPGEVDGKQVFLKSFPGGRITYKENMTEEEKKLFDKAINVTTVKFVEVNGKKVQFKGAELDNRPDFYNPFFTKTEASDQLSFIDLTGLDTSKVKTYSNFFAGRRKLKEIKGLETLMNPNVIDIHNMFYYTSISDFSALASWDVKNVKNIKSLFQGSKISDLTPLKNWDTSNVNIMSYVFASCKELKSLSGLENWNLKNVTDGQYGIVEMFSYSGVEDTTPIKDWNVSNISVMYNLFKNSNVEFVNLSGWKFKENVNFSSFNGTGPVSLFYNDTQKPLLVVSNDVKLSEEKYDYQSNNRVGLTATFKVNDQVISKVKMPIVIKDDKVETYNAIIKEKQDMLQDKINENAPKGHEFDKWETVGTVSNAYEAFKGTYHATYKPKSYTVTFDTDGGNSSIPSQNITYDTLISAPTTPIKEGYVFKEWVNEADNKVWDFSKDKMPDTNIKLKAIWTDQIKVNFNLFGGEFELDSDLKDKTFKIGEKLPKLNATKPGYTLVGWYKDVEFTQPWDFDHDVLPADANFKLYAKWVKSVEILNHVPTIDAKDVVLTVGDQFDVLANVTAKDEEDGIITLNESNVIANDVNVNKVGVYHVTYKVTDKAKASVEKTIQVTVNAKAESDNKINTPNTGDPTSLGMLGSMFITSAGLMVVSLNKKRKDN